MPAPARNARQYMATKQICASTDGTASTLASGKKYKRQLSGDERRKNGSRSPADLTLWAKLINSGPEFNFLLDVLVINCRFQSPGRDITRG